MKRFTVTDEMVYSKGAYVLFNEAHAEIATRDKRITELEAKLRKEIMMVGVHIKEVSEAGARIAQLEKQAALDKTLLALADARINRELRDDFAGRAMQGMITAGGWVNPEQTADEAYVHADAMLKAKGGA